MTIDERPLQWVYPVCVSVGILIALVLPSAAKQVPATDRKRYWILQMITLTAAVVGAKIIMLMGDLDWPRRAIGWEQVVYSGRSLVGGLLFGFGAAELAKPLLGYTLPPNDWFATKLMLSVAIGRVGCVLAGCCRGVPNAHGPSIHYADGIARHPVSLYELLFHVVAFGVLYALYRRGQARGRLFAGYLVAYGLFRFALEPLRETPKLMAGASVYQLACVLLVVGGLWSWRRELERA